MQADSDEENNKVKRRGRRSEVAQDKNDTLLDYYEPDPWHRKKDVR